MNRYDKKSHFDTVSSLALLAVVPAFLFFGIGQMTMSKDFNKDSFLMAKAHKAEKPKHVQVAQLASTKKGA